MAEQISAFGAYYPQGVRSKKQKKMPKSAVRVYGRQKGTASLFMKKQANGYKAQENVRKNNRKRQKKSRQPSVNRTETITSASQLSAQDETKAVPPNPNKRTKKVSNAIDSQTSEKEGVEVSSPAEMLQFESSSDESSDDSGKEESGDGEEGDSSCFFSEYTLDSNNTGCDGSNEGDEEDDFEDEGEKEDEGDGEEYEDEDGEYDEFEMEEGDEEEMESDLEALIESQSDGEQIDFPVVNTRNHNRQSNPATLKRTAPGNMTSNGVQIIKRSRSEIGHTNSFEQETLRTPQSNQSTRTRRQSRNDWGSADQINGHDQNANIELNSLQRNTNVTKLDSVTEGQKALSWLLNPVPVSRFFNKYWEKNACLIRRNQSNYFSHLISFEAIDRMLINDHIEFTKNIDITTYKNGVRKTVNPEGRALPPIVWDYYGQGCSVRLLNPQTFLPQIFKLNATLQEYFHSLVGANVYLTPPNSQGFAPHYDDIEAFVLQIEGRKRWRLYKPRRPSEVLPRFSSDNFSPEEIGNPILDQILQPGDMLYFPRGTIHQACTEPGFHSLHITLSVYQKQSYADLFEKMMPMLLERAIKSNIDMRRGLPLSTWKNAGIAFSRDSTEERQKLYNDVVTRLTKCVEEANVLSIMDAAVDQLAKRFQHEALPPNISPSEQSYTVFGSLSRTNEEGECVCDYKITLRTNLRLLRANILRVVSEEGVLRVYYYLENSKEYCEYDSNYMEVDPNEAGCFEVLIKSYPSYVSVSQFPLRQDKRKIQMATALWERGLLMMEKPFK